MLNGLGACKSEARAVAMRPWYRKRRRSIPVLIGMVVLLCFVAFIDDWKRDFTSSHAEISDGQADPRLKPLILERSTLDSIRLIKRAAGRIHDWEYVGEAQHGNNVQIIFVRTGRLWQSKDDITLRVEDRGDRCILTGESRSRHGYGDLGQNPRNLRRIVDEIRIVADDEEPGEHHP
jgi:uncharacterized protein (DUF1499 family)